ncbi:MAG: cobalamin B12-binding domain-containing protein [Candidatus Binatia bacterium]|nr:cobalamin B12-binding domain-containing protein [Candidatus Binatia bacterium]
MTHERKIRFLLAKAGFDGHDRGAVVVATAMRNAGIEVIYTGLYCSNDGIIDAAIQEDVDAIGLSILNGQQMFLIPEIIQMVKENGLGDIPVFYGGCILPSEKKQLLEAGVAEVFPPGTSTTQIVERVKNIVATKRA